MEKNKVVWKERKRTIFGLPWSFTVYTITEKKLLVDTGLFNSIQEEVMLFRITDMTLTRTLGQKLFGLGTIHCISGDKTTPEIDIKNIKNAMEVKEKLSELVEKARINNRVSSREVMYHDDDNDYDMDYNH